MTHNFFEPYLADDHTVTLDCPECKREIEANKIWPDNNYPKPCECGGTIHVEVEWQGDEGWESPLLEKMCTLCGLDFKEVE